ncbi:Mitochondrial pyruvate carrier 2 [Taxawa tesnikishii (nom. ined.)]|nr:Mitochondrial pyruvate carrier 2 [Dothideales sp. JES 119]
MKWGLVLAGAADFARPAENLSLSQNAALMATGAIWTRWCFIIRPKNLFLASVNFLLFCVGATQTTRVLLYHRSLKDESMGEEIKKAATMEGQNLKQIVEDPKGAIDAAKNP